VSVPSTWSLLVGWSSRTYCFVVLRTERLRVAIASAHYPPNFVSGGTLVPQRSARGLRRRGYDVGVFAGWIGEGPSAFDTWDETDEESVVVRWVATYFGWSDRRNYDNPEVARRFGIWLEEFRPDVVHLHSLQTLGAGLVHEAADRGLPVVVTLHDFWWWCARQFLSDRDLRPCCPVVEAGVCQCEIDRAWLEERNSFTARALARANRVVAVSKSTAAVAVANGVDERRVVVIEPGTGPSEAFQPGQAPGPRTAHAAGPVDDATTAQAGDPEVVRLLYAGGANEMKGIGVLVEAARLLRERSERWRLSCYGFEDGLEGVEGLPVEALPAFAPAEARRVLAEHDVLVVPSVVHESYSTLTREAIAERVPVLCSNSLGPEEVVTDGVNGLVVPAGDPQSLARAIGRIIDEAGLMERLREGCDEVPLPSIDEHLDALVALYEDVLRPPRTAGAALHPVTRVLFVAGIDGAPLRYRVRLPAEALESLGVHSDVRHYLHPDINRLGEDADAVVMYRVPATVQVLQFLAGIRRSGTPILFDVDDLIFDPALEDEIPAIRSLSAEDAELYRQGMRRYRTTLEHSDAFVGSTELLCSHAEAVSGLPAHLFANGVGRVLGRRSDAALHRPRRPGPLRVGYLSGTSTHSHDWEHVEPAVAELLASNTELELWLVGMVEPSAELQRFGSRVRSRTLLPWTMLPELLRDLDVNLSPLAPSNLFNQAKSPVKWLEAALTATPTVASPTAPFRAVINSGSNGMLAGDRSEWVQAVSELLEDEHARRRIGAQARRDALLELAPGRQGRRYLSILRQVSPRLLGSEWVPEAPDEPPREIALEPYPPPANRSKADEAGLAVA
jgi:glycosyltransferase involved in cell wall biosynthesis